MHCRCRLLYLWNHRQKGEEKGRDVVLEWMEVEYYRAQSKNHHLAVVRLICILSFLCGCDRGEWYKRRCRSTSTSSKDTVDKDPSFVGKLKCPNNIKKHLDVYLATHTIASRMVLRKSHPSIYFFQKGVLPLSQDISHPPSHDCIVFNRSLNFNIPGILKSIPHLYSARHSNCFAPSQDPPMPIAWFIVVTFC